MTPSAICLDSPAPFLEPPPMERLLRLQVFVGHQPGLLYLTGLLYLKGVLYLTGLLYLTDDTTTNLQEVPNMTSETIPHETPSESEYAARFRRASADDTISHLPRFSRPLSEATSNETSSHPEIARDHRASADDTITNLQEVPNMTSKTIPHETRSESEIAARFRRASADDTLNSLPRFSRATSEATSNGTSSEIASFRRSPADDIITNLQEVPNMTSETIPHETSSESEIAARFRRASADEIIDNLQRLSRITSGIALEIGLLDGSLAPDAAVRDLLHLGSLAPSQLISMDTSLVNSAMAEFKTLIGGIKSSPEVTIVENRLMILEKIRTSFDIAQLKNPNGIVEYRQLLDDVVKLNGEKAKIDPAKNAANAVDSDLRILFERFNELNDAVAKMEKGRMPSMIANIDNVVKEAKSFDSIKTLLKAAKTLKTKSSFLSLLVSEYDFRESIPDSINYDSVPDLLKIIKRVYSYQRSKSNFKAPLEVLLKLIHSRDDSSVKPFSFASGLSRGATDLELLASDSTDAWIQKKTGAVMDRLKVAFDSLNSVMDHLKSVEDGWKSIHTKSNAAVSNLELQTAIFSLTDKSEAVSKAIDSFKAAGMPGSFRKIADIQVPRGLIEKLNAKTENINTFEYVDKLKDLSVLKTALSASPQPNESDVDFVKRVVKSLNDNPKTSEIRESMEQFHTDLVELKTLIPEITSIVPDIIKPFPVLEDYYKDVTDAQKSKFYTDIAKIGDSGVGEIVGIIRDIRKADVAPATSLVNSALKPQKSLSDAVEGAGNLKTLTTPELISLKGSLQDCLKVAEKLGMGVQGLTAIQTASNAQSTLTPLLDVAAILQASTGLAKEHQDSLQKLNRLVTIFKEIEDFQTTLAGYQLVRKKRDSDFKSLETVFDAAAKISDFKEDLKPIQEAMEALNQAKSNQFADAKAALDKLKALDLEFSRFKIADAKDSLTAMDSFFVEYNKKLKTLPPAIPPPKSPSGKKGPPAASNAITAITESPSPIDVVLAFFQTTPGYIVIAFTAVVLGVGTFFLIRRFCCTKKPDNNDDDGPDSVVVSGQTKTPTTTPGTVTPKPDEDADKKKKDPPPPPPPPPPTSGATGSDSNASKDSKDSHPKPSDSNESNAKGSASKDSMTGGGEQKEEEAPKKDPSDDKTQTNGTVSEAPDLTSTVSCSNQRVSRAVVRQAPKPREASKESKETPKKPKKRVATPMPKGTAVERPKWQVENLKTADEGAPKEQEDELEGTQCSYRHYPCFSLARNMINQFEDFASYSKTPLDWLITQCDIQKAWADTPQHEREDHKFERRCLLYICRQQHRFYLKGFQDTYMNCNFIEVGGYRIYMSQAPQNGDETVHDTGNARRLSATDYKHVAMVHQADIKLIIMLCGLREKNRKTCAEYYPTIVGHTLKYGRYEITLQKKLTMDQLPPMFIKDKEHFVLYKLFIQEKVTGQVKAVDLLTYSGWFLEETPREPEPALQMIQLADSYNKAHVLVHCVDGVGRTGTLVAIKQGILAAQAAQNRNFEVQQIIEQVRQRRFGAVRKPSEVTYIVLCVTKHMMNLYEIKYLRDYWYIWYYHQEVCKDSYNPLKVKQEEMFFVRDKRDRNALDDAKRQEYEPEEEGVKKEADKVVEKPPKEKSMSKKSKKEKSKKEKSKKSKEQV
ncbi:hypothetical protein CAEBREN_22163 [Caenorhabditis brenneri]|uniref:Protein-tyrosine-phosphatase n=1 Tax=Caenorhabditis brenneri TaxID=135651 RepID=G0N679_CAEBE|nr:hypothetical protein CAEBREN_22163 [Caenorhabditis brenneri]